MKTALFKSSSWVALFVTLNVSWIELGYGMYTNQKRIRENEETEGKISKGQSTSTAQAHEDIDSLIEKANKGASDAREKLANYFWQGKLEALELMQINEICWNGFIKQHSTPTKINLPDKSFIACKEVISKGNKNAEKFLGEYFLKRGQQRKNDGTNESQTTQSFKEAAKYNNPQACILLVKDYNELQYLDQAYAILKGHFENRASAKVDEKQLCESCYDAGMQYFNTIGMRDYLKASELLSYAKELGKNGIDIELGKCYFELGNQYYEQGNSEKATNYFIKGAEHGNQNSNKRLASPEFYSGISDQKQNNFEQALTRPEEVKDEKKDEVLFGLGKLHEDKTREEPPHDLTKAISHYKGAASRGSSEGEKRLVELNSAMEDRPIDATAITFILKALVNDIGQKNGLISFDGFLRELYQAERYPLKLSCIIFMENLDSFQAPKVIQELPLYTSIPNLDYEDSVIAVDGSSTGDHETAYCVVKRYAGRYFVLASGGMEGGYVPEPRDGAKKEVKEKILKVAEKYAVKSFICEKSGLGAPIATSLEDDIRATPGHFNLEKHSDGKFVKGPTQSKTKETRILGILRPVIEAQRLIISHKVLEEDVDSEPKDQMKYKLFYQLARFTDKSPKLTYDDRLDALAIAIDALRERAGQKPPLSTKPSHWTNNQNTPGGRYYQASNTTFSTINTQPNDAYSSSTEHRHAMNNAWSTPSNSFNYQRGLSFGDLVNHGVEYFYGKDDKVPDYIMARKFFEEAEKRAKKDMTLFFHLREIYRDGKGVDPDPKKADYYDDAYRAQL